MVRCLTKNRSYFSCPSSLSAGRALLFLGMAGPVIWTITLSHTPLVSGRLWNTTVMLLKSDSAAEEGVGVGKRHTERRWGCDCVFVFFVFLCFLFAPCGRVLTCMNGASDVRAFARACTDFSWQACAQSISSFRRGNGAFYVIGLAVSHFHI